MSDKAQNLSEAEDQNNDSFLEFLDGIDTPPKRYQPFASQSILYEPFSSQYLGVISKCIHNNTSLTYLLKYEKILIRI